MTKSRANATAEAAKGDLRAGSGTNTTTILPVGTDGQTLVADSSTAAGLRYQGSIAGGKNFVINGGFDVWQRSTSSASSNGYFTADRWAQYNTAGSGTYAQTTSVPAGQRYAMRFTSSANGTLPGLYMAFETTDVVRLAGQTVTVSVWLKSSGSVQGNIQLNSATGTDQAWNTTFTLVSTTSVTTTTSWVRYSGQFAIPSNATSLRLDIYSGAVANAGTFEIAGVQMEVGSVATSFSRAGGTIQGELGACQRYYWRFGGDALGQNFGWLRAVSTTAGIVQIQNPVPMRIPPTSIDFGTLAYITPFVGYTAVSALTFENSAKNMCSINATSTSLTNGSVYQFTTNNSTSGYLGFSAEL